MRCGTRILLDRVNATKPKARGFARFQTMRTVLFLIAEKLNFSRFNENAR
jgi:transposase